jgi:tetratricopeptide (TPR) repeat protein
VGAAIESLEKSIKINPKYVEGHYNLALAYWANQDKKKAISEVKKVLELDPTYKAKIKDDVQFRLFKSSPWFNKLIS